MLRLTARLFILWSLLSPSGLAWGAVAQGAALQESGHNIVWQQQAGQGSYEEKLALVDIQADGDVTLDGEAYLEQVNHLKAQVINRAKLVGATVALVSGADVTVAIHAAESAARNNALVTTPVVGAMLAGLEVVDKAMMAHDAHQLVEALNTGDEAKAEELATGLLIAAGLDLAQIPGSSILAKVFNKFPVVQKIVPDGLLAKVGATKSAGKYLNQTWHKGTFPNKTQSVRYHLDNHGKGRTASEYTKDAMDFFWKNKHLGKNITLKDGTPGIKIQAKVKVPGQKTQRVGGYWTQDGKLVTFWD